ncbi:MAG: hypothetical protein DYH15_00565 [Nitrosomonas sp. PRO4]|nr:hypothetical protein [Nitrosomonas sp. PRO4]
MNRLLKFSIQDLFVLIVFVGVFSNVMAHTVLETPQVTELKKMTNNIVIGHGCQGEAVIGTSVVFPDGESSTIAVGNDPHSGVLTDFVQNWGNLFQLLQNRSVFSEQDEKLDAASNVVGFWSGGGRGVAANLNAYVPFTVSAAILEPTSCATSVRFAVAIVDVCKITTIGDFTDDAVSLWTPAVGSKYDGAPGGHAYDSPAFFTINRDLEANPLPENCGGVGVEVFVKPSAAQIDRDMPIIFNGTQVWPQP